MLNSIVEEDEIISTAPQKPAWKAPDLQVSPPVTSPIFDANATPPTTSKKKSAGRFTPKGTKFRDASELLAGTQPGTHFAPWAGTATSPQNSITPLATVILQEEKETSKRVNKETIPVKPASISHQRRRTSGSVSWSESVVSPSPATSPPAPSLAEIMREEERRQREG
ncbi:unnamed protein product [Cylicostephanus goldi]|uniref:Uncharacterized protein n=1 Tax=Cylicostephanus goldi TaxID=71465 RepID=A0A3P6U0B6_CYLGO|nr:unnamed protein product [Cylicostephanus goldi]